MSELANKELTFIVNDKEVVIDPIGEYQFKKSWEQETIYANQSSDEICDEYRSIFPVASECSNEEITQSRRYSSDYLVCVTEAISKVAGEPVGVSNQGGNVAFEAYYVDDGTFAGNFTVYRLRIHNSFFPATRFKVSLNHFSPFCTF